jgi:hypothetical protein
MRRLPGARFPISAGIFEVDMRYEVVVIGRWFSSRVRHGKECDFMSAGAQ